MIQAVLFDMDGLMFDTERLSVQAWDYAGEKLGVGKAGYLVPTALGLSRPAWHRLWAEEFGSRYDEQRLDSALREFYDRFYAENPVPVKPGLYELLAFLKDRKLLTAVVSSTPEKKVRRLLESAETDRFFDLVLGGDRVERSKPDPEIYRTACNRLNVRPDDCLVLEDSRNGLLSAYRAGCRPVMIPDLWKPDEEISALLYAKLDSLAQVPGLLHQRGLLSEETEKPGW